MEEKKLVPKLRFPGFTEPWEQRKLGEMASFSKGNGYFKSDLKSTGIPIILYGRLYTKYETVIKDIDTFADAKEGAVYSLGGEVIVPASGETAEEISIASVVQNPGVLLGGDLNIIRPTENLLPSFLALSISNGSAHRAMSKRAQGKSVVHLHNEDLAQIDLKYPSVEEQSKITACINWVDNLITLHQRKLEHLKLKKKSLLQKLFPKEGEVYPELRFPGFTDPWEQRKFGELFLERREKTTEENEDILLSCAITGIYLNSDLFSHFRGSSTVGYLKVRKNDLILSAQNLHLGNANINFNFEHGMISPAYKVFEIESCDPYFVNAWVKKESTKIFFLKATTEGASQCRKNIDWDALINQELLTPNALEQETIGKFFNQLDRYITLHQRKLEHLQLLKKALLQQLFV